MSRKIKAWAVVWEIDKSIDHDYFTGQLTIFRTKKEALTVQRQRKELEKRITHQLRKYRKNLMVLCMNLFPRNLAPIE